MADSEAAEAPFARKIHRDVVLLRSWEFPTYPGWRLPPGAQKAAGTLRPAIADILESVVKTDDPNVFEAPSPWHAALYCQMLQYHYVSLGSRLLFRGQRNYSWKLEPTLLREVDKSHHIARNELFAEIMSAMALKASIRFHPYSRTSVFLKMDKEVYLAAAQHYGMKTYLLDFTTDPDVAVKFAAGDKASDDGYASILILAVENAEENELSVILPPPFIRRLHLQRGLFVEAEQILSKVDLEIREVRFPYGPTNQRSELGRFEVLRQGGVPVDILPESNELDEVIRATDEMLAKGCAAEDTDEVEKIAQTLAPQFREVNSDLRKIWFEYVDGFEDMLYALAYNIDADNQMSLNVELFERIVAKNVEASCSVAALYREVLVQYPEEFNQGQADHMGRMATFIDEIAATHGYHHADAAEQYKTHFGLS